MTPETIECEGRRGIEIVEVENILLDVVKTIKAVKAGEGDAAGSGAAADA